MTDTPSAVLRQAAARLREMAGKATPGLWRCHDTYLNDGGHSATVLADAQPKTALVAWLPTWEPGYWGTERNVWNNAQWMALASPAIAEPLAAQWEALAKSWDEVGGRTSPARNAVRMALDHALRAARLILEATDG